MGNDAPANIGGRTELFVDDYLIADAEDARLRLHRPRPGETALAMDRPWEGPPDERYKAVCGLSPHGLMAYKSADGFAWEKLQEAPVITEGEFDSHNVWFWDTNIAAYADWRGGRVTTRPLIFDGGALYLNYATSAVGSVRVGMLDGETGKELRGFGMEKCDEIYGNELKKQVTWKGKGDVSKLRGRPVRLVIELKDADLFALEFGGTL